jgi:hypothetical protein
MASIEHKCPQAARAFCRSILCFHTHFRIDLHFLYFWGMHLTPLSHFPYSKSNG